MTDETRSHHNSEQLKLEAIFDPGTSEDQRAEGIQQLLPLEIKNEKVQAAEVNTLGEHVRYYRQVGPQELRMLLAGETATPHTSPTIEGDYNEFGRYLIRQIDRWAGEHAQDATQQFQTQLEALKANPTLEAFTNFCLYQMPRYELFRMHTSQAAKVNNYFGLMSISVGIPFLDPGGFSADERGTLTGTAIAEFVIPNDQVYVHPSAGGLRETEKEVTVLHIRPEWLVDAYCTKDDFAERFVKDPNGPLALQYKQLLAEEPYAWLPYRLHTMLMTYKHAHALEELIPISKLSETDPTNQILKYPFLSLGK